jgi:hypothetical protein
MCFFALIFQRNLINRDFLLLLLICRVAPLNWYHNNRFHDNLYDYSPADAFDFNSHFMIRLAVLLWCATLRKTFNANADIFFIGGI